MVEGSVATGLERIEQRVLRLVRGVLTYFALPTMAWVLWVEIRAGRGSIWLACEAIVIATTTAVLWSRASHRLKIKCTVGLFAAISGFALVIFGPTLGTGLFMLLGTSLAAFFLGRRGSIVVVALLAAELTAATIAASLGALHPSTFAPRSGEWIRISISSVLVLAILAGLIAAVQGVMHAAIDAEAQARAREQSAQRERENVLRAHGASQRLEALGRLSGGIAHDLNNALVVVQTSAEMLQTAEDPTERTQLLQELVAGVARATATARQLRVFGSRAPSRGVRAHPSRVIEELVGVVGRVLPADIVVEARTGQTAAIAMAPAELDQILLNLVLNARDAMPRGGTIVVGCEESNGHVIIEVQDDGAGMLPEVRERIFEPFFTTKPESGTGLGLANVWSKLAECGGTIEVDSAPGRGTTCTLAFTPVHVDEEVARTPAPPKEPVATRSSVLVLEDQIDVRRVLERLLQRRGLDVDAVETVHDALAHLEARPYDLFLTDGMLGDGSSEAAIRAFRVRWPTSPIIVCSGYVDEATFKLDHQLRDNLLFAPKPFEPKVLLALIDQALAKSGDAQT